jgi:hypothetical protein
LTKDVVVLYLCLDLKKGLILKEYIDTVSSLRLKALMQLTVIQNTHFLNKELKKDLQSLREIIHSIDEDVVSEIQHSG